MRNLITNHMCKLLFDMIVMASNVKERNTRKINKSLKIEYDANEYIKKFWKNSICWLNVNVSNKNKKTLPHYFNFKCHYDFRFYYKIVVFIWKYISKITNPITKPQFLTIIKLTYTGIK